MKRSLLIALCLLVAPLSFAQTDANEDVADITNETADEAVATWLEGDTANFREQIRLAGDDLGEVCRTTETFLLNPPAPSGMSVNFADRQVLESSENSILYSYPASFENGGLAIVETQLVRENDSWQAERVGLRLNGADGVNSMADTVQSPFSYILFSLFSVALLILLFRPGSIIRHWLGEGVGYLREHPGVTIFSLIFFYGSFIAGYATGTTLPQVCSEVLQNYLTQSLEGLGILEAVTSQNTPRLATAIFFQNFTFGAFATTFIPASLLAVPAYLFNGPRLFFLALIIGDAGVGSAFGATLSIILYIVELLAYALVAAGGGMMLMTLIREGFGGVGKGYRKLLMMLPLAMLILVVGAWYEAVIIHLFS